jgi:predicted ribosome quality control (RQC) complex YloA/Tae2 family protein
MDPLVLIRVAAVLAQSLQASIVEDFRQEAARRYRLVLRTPEDKKASIAVSLRPELPWIGRPAGRFAGPLWSPAPFTVRARKELAGLRLVSIEKPGPGRVVVLRFSGGRALVAELATHGANLVLLDPEGGVEDAAQPARGAQERWKPGARYAPPPLPASMFVPQREAPEAIEACLQARTRAGEDPFEALRRHFFGVGSAGAALVLAEARDRGVPPGHVLAARLDDLALGRLDPAIEAAEDPLALAEAGALDPDVVRLWPWPPREPGAGRRLLRGADAAGTAGLYYDALERGAWTGQRAEALRTILLQELRRTTAALGRARVDLGGFEDPDRWRRRGEALLAGLSSARRTGEHVVVPDPYDPEGRAVSIPAQPGVPLTSVAEDCFKRHRRAKRGLESAHARVAALDARRERLQHLADAWQGPLANATQAERDLSDALRREGVAVGLLAGTRAQREARKASLPRLEGVREFASRDGWSILAGRTGRDNDRLTFKLAGPDDFWFHAHGVPGAHVVVRNPDRAARPPAATVEEAAATAAWYSEARAAGAVDVQWTRRKYVRRARGGGPGLVVLKRFETVRVKPALPAGAPLEA